MPDYQALMLNLQCGAAKALYSKQLITKEQLDKVLKILMETAKRSIP
ncbi:MAG: hypothetical protein FWF85_06795 [Clostridiales bacterium]|nr:hypothetical protein [Clostridiales bacterium]